MQQGDPSSLARNQTHDLHAVRAESQPLDHQQSARVHIVVNTW